ncbi:hypothetical protein KR009_009212 [Drosophila setifemur]|nr:hypothetical protein KR009_009212 [Drosophila setifemur]
MSWLNNSLSTLKGQLTNLAQEVLAETAGPGDPDFQGAEEQAKTALELLAETQQQKEQLDRRCEEKDRQIAALRREVTKLKSHNEGTKSLSPSSAAGREAQPNEDQNVEDSWCWEPDGTETKVAGTGAAAAAGAGSGGDSGLVDIALGNDGSDVHRLKQRITELEQLNQQLNASLEELDAQHELAMRDVLQHKAQLAEQVSQLKQTQADRLVEHELAQARLQKQLDELQKVVSASGLQQEELQMRVGQQELELKQGVHELAEMQLLLEKRGQDNTELIERVRLAEGEREKLLKELESSKEKKTSESSSQSSSTGKHSEDEFIVVRQDAEVTPPPTKEKLRDRLVSLENQVSELTLANNQLQDGQLEKQLSINLVGEQLAELEQRLRLSEAEKEQLQLDLQLRLQQLTVQNQELKLHAEAEQEGHAQDLEEQLGSLREDNRRLRQERDASIAQAKFRQAIAEEKQEITDLDETDAEDGIGDLEKLRSLLLGSSDSESSPPERLERTWTAVRERWRRLDSTEQRLAELQDQQLVTEHEKKTLEADISQYILQCDELMKNNELLLNELDKFKRNKLETIEEHHEEIIVQLEGQLEDARQRLEVAQEAQRELQEELAREEPDQQLKEREREREQERAQLEQQLAMAKQLQVDLKEQLTTTQQELQDKTNLLEESEQQLTKTQQELQDQTQLLQKTEAQLAVNQVERQAEQGELPQLLEKIQAGERSQEELAKQLAGVQQELETRSGQLKASEDQHKAHLAKVQEKIQADQERLRELLHNQDKLEQQKELMEVEQNQQLSGMKKDLLSAENQLQECQEKLLQKEEQLSEIQQELKEILAEKQQLEEKSGGDGDGEVEGGSSNQTQELGLELEKKNQELAKINEELAQLREQHQEQLQQQQEQLQQLQQSLDSLGQEKQELIKALQQKHLENTQYYAEIQRLQPFEGQLKEFAKEREKLQDQISFLKEKSDILTTNLLTEQTNQRLLQQQQAEQVEQQANVQRDLERLRAHLLEMEEQHTQEQVELQRDLEQAQSRRAQLEHEVSKSSTAYTSASIRANQQAETLQAQHGLLQQQRDELLAKLGQYEDRELKQQAALTNLQCALEQFQNDKEHDIQLATLRIKREMQGQLERQGQLQAEMGALQQQLADANQGLRAAARLSDQLEAGQQTIAVLRDEVESLKEANGQLEKRLNSSESSQTDKIDKSLIKSLLIGYVVSGHAGDKQQVLRMISSVLDFSAQESDKVGLNRQQSSWLGSILGGGHTSGGSARGNNDNLVQAFVQFLEQESQPQTQVQNRPMLLSMAGQVDMATSSTAIATATATATTSTSTSTSSLSTLPPQGAQTPQSHQDVQEAPSGSGSGSGSPQSLAGGSSEFAPSRNSSSILKDILSDS